LYYGYGTAFGFPAFAPELLIYKPVETYEAVFVTDTRQSFGNLS
jgi:hypothetical protein